ncbi:hypothetical protein GCM10023201_20210 [Actinomycetospora corticicola]|uniref:Uncharacterized protein n=1 Tax=Actinomycetospora corticicola TaxID=663602 RepID=A0A7Y9DSM5_9PSEU|nr:hypothetical protein [Actinomycetospora corticicola]NYD34442.1 hypothetical protein [Actinomycetospora corticicola]
MSAPAPERGTLRAAGAVVAVALVAVLLIIVLWIDGGRATFVRGGVAAATGALETAGLTVCARTGRTAAAPSAVEAVTLDVADGRPGCTTGPVARIGVERFDSAGDRDAAAQTEEVRVRPRGSTLVHTFDDLVVSIPGLADDDLTDRISAALTARGAR